MTSLVLANLLSPIILSFVLGIIARLVRSDLEYPPALSSALSLFLLFAIGLKGGEALSHAELGQVLLPAIATMCIGISIPLWVHPIARFVGRLTSTDASALAAHYGSTSAVTFLAALSFLDQAKVSYEGFMPALLAIMEVPALVVALLLARRTDGHHPPLGAALHHVLTGKSILLLVGGLIIGVSANKEGMTAVAAFFVAPFKGVLCLFLMELGMLAAQRLGDLRGHWGFLVLFAILAPIVHGLIGVTVGHFAGLSIGGATVLGVLSASASYIAAPAAVRLALPEANLSMPLACSLGITFPFNLALGLPLYHTMAQWIGG